MSIDARRHAPATGRNREPILAVLRRVLPPAGLVLEVASGTGEHAIHFARAMPNLAWQPSDPDPSALESIAAWRAREALPNLLPPIELDAAADGWPVADADAVFCANMTHIAPWTATEGLLRGAGRLLPPGGPLVLYGPYRKQGVPTAPGNEAFDADLRARDSRWGLRRLEEVAELALTEGLRLEAVQGMPANNLVVIFRQERELTSG